jgi:hypothetical protein
MDRFVASKSTKNKTAWIGFVIWILFKNVTLGNSLKCFYQGDPVIVGFFVRMIGYPKPFRLDALYDGFDFYHNILWGGSHHSTNAILIPSFLSDLVKKLYQGESRIGETVDRRTKQDIRKAGPRLIPLSANVKKPHPPLGKMGL